MGKCKFSGSWTQDPAFKDWLRPVVGNNRQAYCSVCKKAININWMGANALRSHMQSTKHKNGMRGRKDQLTLPLSTLSTAAPSHSPLPQTTATTVQANVTVPATNVTSDLRMIMGGTPTLRAEALWCLNTAVKHHSLNSNEGISELFKEMFPDSEIAKSFTCGKDKGGYIIRFGLGTFFKKQLVDDINKAGPFVLMFDESLNQASKKKQLDIHVRYWDGRVQSRYFGSQFLGHGKADDLLHHIKQCVTQLNMRDLVSIGMDGPNVNFKLMDLLQKEHAELYGGAQIVTVGSCGLHTLHNALKAGFTVWQLEKLLRAMHFLFHNVPARREEFTSLTGSSCFPLPFCGHRWVENVPVAERAVEVWPVLKTYVDAAEKKRVPAPSTASYDTIVAAQKDPFIVAKLQFFLAVARTFNPFLTKFQTDEPVLPFLAKELTELLMSLLRRFVQRELLQDLTPQQLIKIDLTDGKNLVSPKSVDIGLGAETAIKELLSKPGCKVGELSVLNFRRECLQGLVKVIVKLQEKSPLKFPVVRQIGCLDPGKMHHDPDWCIRQMKGIVQTFHQGKQLAGGIPAGDVIIQQYTSLLSLEARDESFRSFQPWKQRVDVFLHSALSTPYTDLLRFSQSLLLLSHGQATVERGFSINKEVETCNLLGESLESLRLICDNVSSCGGVLKVPLTKDLLASVASARSRYRLYLEDERKKRESVTQTQKRKAAEEELAELRQQRKVLYEVCAILESDANKLAEEAEGKAGTKMAQLITKSNTLRRRYKEKKEELVKIDKIIEEKAVQLRHLP